MQKTDLNNQPLRTIIPGYHVRFVHTQNMTLAFWEIEDGAELPPHNHPHEQVTHIISGTFELTVGDQTEVLGPQSVVVIPSGENHRGKALTQCQLMDVFYPVREEYL